MLRSILLSIFFVTVCAIIVHAEDPPVYTLQWGSFGSALGEFNLPLGIAVNSTGQVFVADTFNHRFQKFSADGAPIVGVGLFGTDPSYFDSPSGIAIGPDDGIFVADSGNHRIQRFTPTPGFILEWGSNGSENGEFTNPYDLVVDANGSVYVTESGSNHRVQKFTSSGIYLTQWGSFGTANGEFNTPNGIAVDASGDVYVVDKNNFRVQKFDSTGVYISQWGAFGGGDGQFISPIGVAVDALGDVYVADNGGNRVQKFDNTGTFLSKWGSAGSGDGQFQSVPDVDVSGSLFVYTIDRVAPRVQKFTYDRDLALTALSIPGESRVQCTPGTIWVTFENLGAMNSGAFDASVRISTDPAMSLSDLALASYSFPSGLDAGADTTFVLTAPFPTDAPRGVVYIGAIVDENDTVVELDENNNSASNVFTYNVPIVDFVRDIPGDQGGEVFLAWYGSPLDSPDEGGLITEYTLWRAINATAAAEMLESGKARLVRDGERLKLAADSPVIRASAASCGPYFWQQVDTQPAWFIPTYGKPVATLFDSTSTSGEYQYFQVMAHTADPLTFYTSNPDSARSVDNLGPAAPANFFGDQVISPEGLTLMWDPNVEPDLFVYALYKSTDPGFTPGPGNLVTTVVTESYFDDEWRWDNQFYYKLSAIDTHENESPFSDVGPEQVTGIGDAVVPRRNFLAQNHPNPFNPTTTIRFGLIEASHVSLQVYDAGGRLVRTLVDESRPAGPFTVEWDGRNEAAQPVASGIYFYRLTAGEFVQTRKMVMLK